MEYQRKNQGTSPPGGDLTVQSAASAPELAVPKLVLASSSPRRAEILRTVGWPFEVLAVNIDESRRDGEDAMAYVERLALSKAEAARSQRTDATIVAADTVVVVDGQILGKPRDHEDARRMLRLLQDHWHQVVTGVVLISPETNQPKTAHEVTEVEFAAMTEEEISWYVSTYEPMDKAGAYAIQGLGARFIEGIKGDYFNIVGLPVRLLYSLIGAVARP